MTVTPTTAPTAALARTLKQSMTRLTVPGRGPGMHEITSPLAAWVRDTGIRDSLLTVFVPHTSATLLIQENADAHVAQDLQDFFARIAPEGPGYRHQNEGPDDMPAHIRSALTQTQVAIPVMGARLQLGTWQGVSCSSTARSHARATSYCT